MTKELLIYILLIILSIFCFYILGYINGRQKERKREIVGKFLIEKVDGKTQWTIDVSKDPNELLSRKEVRFKIYVLDGVAD